MSTKTKKHIRGPKLVPVAELLTPEKQKEAVELAVQGASTAKIAERLGLSSYAFWEYRQNVPLFSNKYEIARIEGMESLADGLLTIVDRYDDVQAARLQSDNTKWLLSKRNAKKYGDRLDVNVSQTVDISGALNEALNRAAIDITPDIKQIDEPTMVEAADAIDADDVDDDASQDHGVDMPDIFS